MGAVVLLVLRGVHAGVVGAHDDQPPVHAREREGHERIGRHVEAHVLHGDDGAPAGQRSPNGGLEGDLLVDAPLGMDALEMGGRLEDLGGRRARIPAGETGPSAHGAVGDGFVPREEESPFHGTAIIADPAGRASEVPTPTLKSTLKDLRESARIVAACSAHHIRQA
jgi:hypothetical protein